MSEKFQMKEFNYEERDDTISVSEIAGKRLYENALKTRQMIEEKRNEKERVPKPVLIMESQKNSSRVLERLPDQPPRHVQLYEEGTAKKLAKKEAEKEAADEMGTSFSSLNLGAANKRCDRLYSLSSAKQEEGKKRRDEIKKSLEKAPLPDYFFKKIPISEATNMYDKGMKTVLSLESKRMQAAFDNGETYTHPLFKKQAE